MERDFWLQRWRDREIGWHQAEINTHLSELWPRLHVPSGTGVLVPLCGKSRDMVWLAGNSHPVLGIEISDIAIRAFFDENAVVPTRQPAGLFERWTAADISILCGDFFQLTHEDIASVGAVYDRASLIALPPELRRQYARTLSRLLAPGTKTLLITMEYPQTQMAGPPFSVTEEEVRALFEPGFRVDCLRTIDILAENARFQQRGLTELREKVYRLQRLRQPGAEE